MYPLLRYEVLQLFAEAQHFGGQRINRLFQWAAETSARYARMQQGPRALEVTGRVVRAEGGRYTYVAAEFISVPCSLCGGTTELRQGTNRPIHIGLCQSNKENRYA